MRQSSFQFWFSFFSKFLELTIYIEESIFMIRSTVFAVNLLLLAHLGETFISSHLHPLAIRPTYSVRLQKVPPLFSSYDDVEDQKEAALLRVRSILKGGKRKRKKIMKKKLQQGPANSKCEDLRKKFTVNTMLSLVPNEQDEKDIWDAILVARYCCADDTMYSVPPGVHLLSPFLAEFDMDCEEDNIDKLSFVKFGKEFIMKVEEVRGAGSSSSSTAVNFRLSTEPRFEILPIKSESRDLSSDTKHETISISSNRKNKNNGADDGMPYLLSKKMREEIGNFGLPTADGNDPAKEGPFVVFVPLTAESLKNVRNVQSLALCTAARIAGAREDEYIALLGIQNYQEEGFWDSTCGIPLGVFDHKIAARDAVKRLEITFGLSEPPSSPRRKVDQRKLFKETRPNAEKKSKHTLFPWCWDVDGLDLLSKKAPTATDDLLTAKTMTPVFQSPIRIVFQREKESEFNGVVLLNTDPEFSSLPASDTPRLANPAKVLK